MKQLATHQELNVYAALQDSDSEAEPELEDEEEEDEIPLEMEVCPTYRSTNRSKSEKQNLKFTML